MPVPSEPADKPPSKVRLLTTVVPLAGMVKEAASENLSNLTAGRLAILNDEPVLPASCSEVASFVRDRVASTVRGTEGIAKEDSQVSL